MPHGRHALPGPPHSTLPVTGLSVAVGIVAVAAVWLVDGSIVVEVAATAIVVVVVLASMGAIRESHRVATAMWREATDRRHEYLQLQRELSEVRSEHVELLLQLHALHGEVAATSAAATSSVQAAFDQRALMQELLVPRQPVADPVYPSMHLPLVRAAFAAEVSPVPSDRTSETIGGDEPVPPRQLLDLTASEIARLRPAN